MRTILISIFTAITSIVLLAEVMTTEPKTEELTFVWNDTEDSLPQDGELVQIEFTKGNTVYLAPIEE